MRQPHTRSGRPIPFVLAVLPVVFYLALIGLGYYIYVVTLGGKGWKRVRVRVNKQPIQKGPVLSVLLFEQTTTTNQIINTQIPSLSLSLWSLVQLFREDRVALGGMHYTL